MSFTSTEIAKLEQYFQKRFGNPLFQVRARPKAPDSLEFLLGGEFLGVIYKDTEDGEIAYNVNLTVLDLDLEDV